MMMGWDGIGRVVVRCDAMRCDAIYKHVRETLMMRIMIQKDRTDKKTKTDSISYLLNISNIGFKKVIINLDVYCSIRKLY